MKKLFVRRRDFRFASFTLIELLVVIAIIAVLAGVLLSAGTMAIKAAQKAKAFNMASQIQSGCLNYYNEYSLYPAPMTSGSTLPTTDTYISDTDKADWASVLYGLCGNVNPWDSTTAAPSGAAANTRAIQFLSLKKSDVDVNNAPLNPLPPSTTELYFFMAMDTDYDGLLGTKSPTLNQLPNFSKNPIDNTGSATAGIAVWANCSGKTTLGSPNWWVHTY